MAIYTYDEAKTYLNEALAARSAVLTSQSYQKGDRSLQRAMLADVNKDIAKWEKECTRLQNNPNGGMVMKRIVPNG